MKRWFNKWWILFGYARLDRHCAKHGHNDFGCYSLAGSNGDKCGHCGRILWTFWPGMPEGAPPRYQAPSRQTHF